MASSNTNHPIPPNHSLLTTPDLVVTPQDLRPSSQRQSIPDPFFSSHIHPTPMLTFPLPHHPEHPVLGPSGATHPMHPHNQHTPPLILGHQPWYPAVSPPTLHLFHPGVVPNMEPREEAPATYEHLSPSHAAPANAYPTPMVRQPTHSRVTTYPSTRVSFRKKTRPAADYTPNLGLVQAHCIADGGDPATINLLHIPFADGISTEALTRRMTRDEARKYNQGASGQAFRMFLHADEENRFHCRLCAVGTDEEGWKQARDALRHLKREYFGLGFRCNRCGKIAYTKGELTRHRCVAAANPTAAI